MYVPPAFAQTDRAVLYEFIEAHSFGILVSPGPDGPAISHVPLLVDRAAGPQGALVGHLARANPHAARLAGPAVAIFSGPHAYVSPAWYESDGVVPTWNYVAVHAYGRVVPIDEPAATWDVLRAFVRRYERDRPRPWSPAADDPVVERLAAGVVAFRLEIERLEGKWKLSQNQPRARQEKVAAALAQDPDANARAVAALMRAGLEGK